MEQVKINMDEIFPIKQNLVKPKKVSKNENDKKVKTDDFNEILDKKLQSVRKNKCNCVNKEEEKEKTKDSEIENILAFLQEILSKNGIKIDLTDLKTEGTEKFETIKNKLSELLKLSGMSDKDVEKMLSDIDEIKFKDFMKQKKTHLIEKKDVLLNTKKTENIVEPDKLKHHKKASFGKIDSFNPEKIKLDFALFNKTSEKRIETNMGDKGFYLKDNFFSMNNQNVGKTENSTGEIKTLKVEKPADILKFVDFIKLSQIKGGQKLTVKLHPEHLGNMRIELHDVSGKVSAKIFVESHEAKNMLVAQTDLIRQHLESKGINFTNIDFSFFHDDSNHKENFQRNNGSGKFIKEENVKIINENQNKEIDALYA